MESLEEVTDSLYGIASGFGINLDSLGQPSNGKKIVCFNKKGGERLCEEVPSGDEIKCDNNGLCSVYISNIEKSNPVEDWAKKIGARSFPVKKEGFVTKTLSGIIPEEKIETLSSLMGRKLNVTNTNHLRTVKKGDIPPPSICKINPLSPNCEPYMESRDWYYIPFKGFIKADNFSQAIKLSISNRNPPSDNGTKVTQKKNDEKGATKVLTNK